MSDAQNQGEPTMEEILASIRKIISEDGTAEGEEATDQEAAAEAEPAAAEPEAVPEAPAEEAAADEAPVDQAPAAEAAEAAYGDDDDVLDLTRMVGEDGDVVDLAEVADEAPVAEDAAPAVELPDLTADELDDDDDEASSIPDLIAVDGGDAVEPELPAGGDEASLLADTTQAAVTGSLSDLSDAASPQNALAGALMGNNKTLEVLVREVMEPYLKSWLDENLAGLVERIVRDEVQKMARRAEYR